jgi:hypothetical protein
MFVSQKNDGNTTSGDKKQYKTNRNTISGTQKTIDQNIKNPIKELTQATPSLRKCTNIRERIFKYKLKTDKPIGFKFYLYTRYRRIKRPIYSKKVAMRSKTNYQKFGLSNK